jgi:D-sedoheptulose 7-phosphate isomerase
MSAPPALRLAPTSAERHLDALTHAVAALRADFGPLPRWAAELAAVLSAGGRLLAVGNGGSAAQAQHLTSELVGRYCSERRPFSALALHADASSVTAIANDYGVEQVFGRQVRAHGRPGDILVALSTSGRSPNIVAAVGAARERGLRTWALTGPRPNPVASLADDALAVDAAATATVQELHLVAVHLLCELLDELVCP